MLVIRFITCVMPEHIEVGKPTANENKQSMAVEKRIEAKRRPLRWDLKSNKVKVRTINTDQFCTIHT